MSIDELRAADWQHRAYRDSGAWRGRSPLRMLQSWRLATPEAIALIAHRAGVDQPERITYEAYACTVERFAGALRSLGVGPGQTVALQLPNWWQAAALVLACERVGATVAPIVATFGARELELMLARTEATICVTPDRFGGVDYAGRVAEMTGRLPALRHQVVIGDRVPRGAVSFADHFERTPWEMDLAYFEDDPDRPAMVMFTSGTSGHPKGALHSHNTMTAGVDAFIAGEDIDEWAVTTSPHSLMHIAGLGFNVLIPLAAGGTGVLRDVWSPVDSLRDIAEDGVTLWLGAPAYLSGLLAAQELEQLDLKTLDIVMTGATSVPPRLAGDVARVLGRQLRAAWAMTEVAGLFWTRRTDPSGWAAHSDGRPGYATEFTIRPIDGAPEGEPGRLFVRGPSVCLATISRDSDDVTVIGDHDQGWYDTGDLARYDGACGIRLAGRAADRISGVGGLMIPVADVEAELLNHPGIADVALVGYLDDSGWELPCAWIVPDGVGPTVTELRNFLTKRGVTSWYQPSRILTLDRLPRNAAGKVLKADLKARLIHQ